MRYVLIVLLAVSGLYIHSLSAEVNNLKIHNRSLTSAMVVQNDYHQKWLNEREADIHNTALQKNAIINSSNTIVASWYDYDCQGSVCKTTLCDGDSCYSMQERTCASREYERGTILHVEYKNRFTTCRVNDYIEHPLRHIDLSSKAFSDLAPLEVGLIEGVTITPL